eukprot:Gb_02140 [translate_table: standard]
MDKAFSSSAKEEADGRLKRRKLQLPSSFRNLFNISASQNTPLKDEPAESLAVLGTERSGDRISEDTKDEDSFSEPFFNSETDLNSHYEVDEYGIPHENSLPGSDTGDDAVNFLCVKETEIRDESFTESFYASGTDWTSVCNADEVLHCSEPKGLHTKGKMNGKLVQANLSTLWGLKSNFVAEETVSSLKDVSNSVPLRMKSIRGELLSSFNGKCSFPAVKPSQKKGNSKTENRREKFGGEATRQRPKTCPFYKKMPGTSFTVDAFRYGSVDGCTAYFLTHFHSDHYGGLSKWWSHGHIYCTPTTGRLLALCLSVDAKFIRPLELNTVHVIDGIEVLMLEANHCPGAALIYFRLKDGRCFLHTGDFRACKEMQNYAVFRDSCINILYLDTTYCNPKYRFPPQKDVINYVVKVTKNALLRDTKTLVVVGAYSIGKERVYLGIAEALGVQIYADSRRRRILESLNWPQLSERLCLDAQHTLLHVLPMSSLSPEETQSHES